jgi:hypothetical protein
MVNSTAPGLRRVASRRSFWIVLVLASLLLTRWTAAAPLPAASAPAGLGAADWGAIQQLLPAGLVQQAYLKASNTGAADMYGVAVAVDGDTVVVGASSEASAATGINGVQSDNSARYAGAAYVLVRANGVWSQQAYLKASNTDAYDSFGSSVAISGDTIVVGAYNEASAATGVNGNQADNSASGTGAAYVFTRSNGAWSQQAYLKPHIAAVTGAYFGYSVAIDGDTVVVGASQDDVRAFGVNSPPLGGYLGESGAAYVFARSGGVWSQQAYLKASNADYDDYFGEHVAIDGDTVVVGAIAEDSAANGVNGDQASNAATDSGAAYVFARSGGVWSQQAYLKASNTGTFDAFGLDVAVSGDTVVVGAPDEGSAASGVNGDQANNSAPDSGAAYVFTRAGGAWSQQAYLKASNTRAGASFGWGLALEGDTLAVSALRESSAASGINGDQSSTGAAESGAAYIFVRSGGVWGQQTYLKASNTGAGDLFGHDVALSGDTLIIGAFAEDSAATGVNGDQASNAADGAGAAYVFAAPAVQPTATPTAQPTATVPPTATPTVKHPPHPTREPRPTHQPRPTRGPRQP